MSRRLRGRMLCRVEVQKHALHIRRLAVIDDVLARAPHRRNGWRPVPRALLAPVANRKDHGPPGLRGGFLDGVADALIRGLSVEALHLAAAPVDFHEIETPLR